MINITQSENRHHADHGWLDTRWHFSFGDYYDPANMNFSALRVFNDDIVLGAGGFDMHPHRDMEIVTIMVDGQLRHEDSLGNAGLLRPGEVQVMSAGKGIVHAERNNSATQSLRLLQLWLMPRHRGNTPRWEQKAFDAADRHGKLLPVVSSGDVPGTLTIDQDARIYLATLDNGQVVTYDAKENRKQYLFVISGSASVNGKPLSNGDQARIHDESRLNIQATAQTELILLDLP